MRSMTRPGWALVTLSAALAISARLLGLTELYVLATIAVLAVLVAVILVSRPLPSIAVERVVRPRRVHLGDRCRVELRVTNQSRRPTPLLTLFDPVQGTSGATMVLAPLDPEETRAAGYRLPTERRGIVAVGPLDAVRSDPLGLASRRHRIGAVVELTVLPAIESLGTWSPGGGFDDPMAGAARPTSGPSGDDEFSSLRPYVVGDDIRRIHWPSAARNDELLVRQNDPPWQGHLTVLLDAREGHIGASEFEVAVSAAASVLHAVAERGDRTRLLITDGTDTGPTDARSARDVLLEHLAVVHRHRGADLPEPAPDQRSATGDLLVLTGRVDHDEIARLSFLRHRFATTHVVAFQPGGTVAGVERLAPVSGIEVVLVPIGTPLRVALGAIRSAARQR